MLHTIGCSRSADVPIEQGMTAARTALTRHPVQLALAAFVVLGSLGSTVLFLALADSALGARTAGSALERIGVIYVIPVLLHLGADTAAWQIYHREHRRRISRRYAIIATASYTALQVALTAAAGSVVTVWAPVGIGLGAFLALLGPLVVLAVAQSTATTDQHH